MKSYKDLEIYKISYDLAVKVHKFSLTLPSYEMYEEGSQVRKSSKGITSCIVEGYGRKRYKAEFIKFLVYAHASCDETIQHLNFIGDTHNDYVSKVKSFIDSYEELGAKINRFTNYVEKEWNSKWVPNTKPVTRNS
ncbi:MAG: four helix bundle protein [Syntrophaceae bacterium]|nr:four helix bundle protein [Syntrophaceae bacterium]